MTSLLYEHPFLIVYLCTVRVFALQPHASTELSPGCTGNISSLLKMHILVYFGVPVIAFIAIYFIVKKLQGKESKRFIKPGTVLLHQFSPSDLAVSGSPPCLKLETFLRMAKIPYESEYGMKFSKKGKVPWIEFNGQEIADSNFCIRFLMKEFRVDMDSHLNFTDRAIGHSIRTMLEENTYW